MDKRQRLIQIAEDTLNKVKHHARMQEAIDKTVLYAPKTLTDMQVEPEERFEMLVETTSETTLAAAKRLKLEGFEKVACLNFASAKHPGGGFLTGASAQEESLARSSGLYLTLSQEKVNDMYVEGKKASALYTDYLVYSPDVPVVKDDDGNLLEQDYVCSFLTCAAPNAGVVRQRDREQAKQIDGVMRRRIENVFKVAQEQKNEALVLGAFGCGVFQNNPYAVANIFKLLLVDARFQNQFKKIVFAVYDVSPKKETFHIFKTIIGNLKFEKRGE